MAHLHELSASSFAMRSREVAFLANALAAGASLQSRAFTPAEAADGAVAICNLGLEGWPGSARETFLVDHDLVRAFQRGWAILHRDVSLLVGETLLEAVTELHPIDLDIEQGLLTLRRTLVTHLKAGTPWLAAEALDVLATLDITAWASLVGLLGECPVIPEALQAILDRRSTPVSATAFQFISTSRHLDLVRAFVLDLPAVFRS